jgi:hypothetical protein
MKQIFVLKRKYVDILFSVVNLTNILREAFLYESFTQSIFVLEVKVKLFIGARKLAQLH